MVQANFSTKTRLIFHAKTCVQNFLQPNLAIFHYRGHTRTIYVLSPSMRKLLASLAHQIIRIYLYPQGRLKRSQKCETQHETVCTNRANWNDWEHHYEKCEIDLWELERELFYSKRKLKTLPKAEQFMLQIICYKREGIIFRWLSAMSYSSTSEYFLNQNKDWFYYFFYITFDVQKLSDECLFSCPRLRLILRI